MSRLLLPMPGNGDFAARLAAAGAFELGPLEVRAFPDGERYVRIDADVGGRDVALVCTLAQADQHFLPLAFAADALRDLGAASVTLVAPYLGYMRQDARFQPGEAVTSRTFARLLSSTVDGLLTVDPHLHRFTSLDELYSVPAQALPAAAEIGAWVAREAPDALVVGPDSESVQWAEDIANAAGVPFVVLQKRRTGDRQVSIEVPDLNAYRGRRAVLVDDIASSGRTLATAAHGIIDQGFGAPDMVVVHALFADDALAAVQRLVQRVISTDTVAHSTNAISVAPHVAEALARF
ncbi:ribose-phosphate diphosphokinase [Phenylobacterium sp.]|uniref:ribose-phosphate diphosphokinase n=1 Tax=Phenylobacterium sp. TaxID=1871053 RepID=UPI003BAA7EEB